ncbi:hypothetical protein H310_13159 [Aphanomyces invadans]|uniref:Uncharacterized protein n=1 Tax=Aphanomyces invadans TaxID=157072 RepID=A0A024TFB8_9STRA|nr:hypothetical protein H310_13159 [Aphanomyces invadans]ETV92738.1 hypothetical protein H310_13159 [Aphanomyces invadans]|eukprot:XP_008878774.1 hypothetical protein H310_13159 [Aphanomyces invadans]
MKSFVKCFLGTNDELLLSKHPTTGENFRIELEGLMSDDAEESKEPDIDDLLEEFDDLVMIDQD